MSLFEKGLTDILPARRAIAGCIVARRGDAKQRETVRKLLADVDPWVRLRAAQGLLGANDKSGVPALIGLLETAPVYAAWQAEELLHYIAGVESPAPVLGAGKAEDRKTCKTAWEAWWKANGARIDLAKVRREPRRPGLFLGVVGESRRTLAGPRLSVRLRWNRGAGIWTTSPPFSRRACCSTSEC